MKKTEVAKTDPLQEDELLPEYDFDYSKARPNRFADSTTHDRVFVSLDDDVAQVFADSESVNSVLRALIATMPKSRRI